MIATAITSNYIIQVSDRRLTDSRTWKAVTDNAIKATVLDWHTIVGYTGLSKLPTTLEIAKKRKLAKPELNTEDWIAETLLSRPVDSNLLFDHFLDKAQNSLEKLPSIIPDNFKRQAFIAATWMNTPDELFPIIWQVSNLVDVKRYQIEMLRLPPDRDIHTLIHFSTSKVTAGTRRKAQRLKGRLVGPKAMGRILVDMIRHEAKYNPTIGESVYQVSIPRKYSERVIAENEYSYVDPAKIIPDLSEDLVYKHIAAGENSDKGTHVSPVMVTNNNILKGFTIGNNARWTVTYNKLASKSRG